jgi:2-keto-4-pentenoate hydratase/2-oxohepta-3-ene-1,7-dioic acid hydratase in catechol pathway
MRVANADGRAMLVLDDGIVDISTASGGALPSDPQAIYERWDEVRALGDRIERSWNEVRALGDRIERTDAPLERSRLLAPVPRPRQVFAIGMNYAAHAAEAGTEIPEHPPTFTKFPTCLTGPDATVVLPTDFVDWEVELVVVIGREARAVSQGDGWSHVAGVTIGQDLSERMVQLRPPVPQFSLGKSYPGFGPIGPWIVTPDELPNPDDLAIGCSINGEEVQKSRTSDLIFGVDALIYELSSITPLLPGDLIFTGTPSGIGGARTPPRFLAPGDELESTIEGIGTMLTHLVDRSTP